MSHDNLELAHRVMAGLGERDAEGLIALADPEVEWHSFFALSAGGVYRGHAGTRQYMSDLADAFEAVFADVQDELALGDVTLLVGRICYRGKDSGVEGAAPSGWMLKFRDGRLIRFRAFRDPEQVLEAVGLHE